MSHTITEYHRPTQIEEALRLLARRDATVVALGGGTHLIGRHRRDVDAVVDLRDLGLSYLRREGDVLRIGATTTLQSLIDAADLSPAWEGEIARVVERTRARNLREAGTVAGTLVAAEHNNPLATLLIAIGATVAIAPGNETVALDEFLPDRSRLMAGSLLTEIVIPLPHPGEAVAFEQVARTPADLPIVCAAVRAHMADGAARQVRIGLGGVAAWPLRAGAFEHAIESRLQITGALDAATADLDPPSDYLGSADYRRQMAVVTVMRAVERLRTRR